MKNGLVLEGGALRGMFSVGVTDVFMENGINFDGFIGVSAGAAFGCNIKSRQIGRAVRYNTRYCNDWRYCSIRSFLKTGDLFGAEFCYRTIPLQLDPFDCKTFQENPIEFHLVCTDVDTGLPKYVKCDVVDDKCFEWIRASASMPVASRPVEIDGHEYMDGAVSDSIPLAYFQSIGYEHNVVILTQPEGFRKKPPHLMPLVKLMLRKHPALAEALAHRHELYNRQIEFIEGQAKKGTTYIIRPEATLPIKRISSDPKKLQATYELGRQAGQKHLEAVRTFLCGISNQSNPKCTIRIFGRTNP